MHALPRRIRLLILLSAITSGCADVPDNEPERERTQTGFNGQLRISDDAQERIGLTSVTVRSASGQDSLSTTGWLEVAPGAEVVIKAAVTGFYLPDSEEPGFSLGSLIKQDQRIGSIQVIVSPQEQAQLVGAKEEVDILINQSKITRELAETQLNRIKRGAENVVAGTRLLELEEVVRRSNVAEQEARDKLPFLPKEPYQHHLDLRPVPTSAPIAGRVTKIHVAPRQLVVQGDPLWTIGDWSKLWIRVPVVDADVHKIIQQSPSLIHNPGMSAGIPARPINAPQPTEVGRRTVDLFYEVDNTGGSLRPGQSVAVTLPMSSLKPRLIVPETAVVWDGMGNSWVYVRHEAEIFRRLRIEVQPISGGFRVDRGLRDGDIVVTVGAQALYGEEFAGQISADDDD